MSPDIFWWGGGLVREGVGAEKFGMSVETQGIKLFWRDIPGFSRDIPEAPEKFEKKMFGFNSRLLVTGAAPRRVSTSRGKKIVSHEPKSASSCAPPEPQDGLKTADNRFGGYFAFWPPGPQIADLEAIWTAHPGYSEQPIC